MCCGVQRQTSAMLCAALYSLSVAPTTELPYCFCHQLPSSLFPLPLSGTFSATGYQALRPTSSDRYRVSNSCERTTQHGASASEDRAWITSTVPEDMSGDPDQCFTRCMLWISPVVVLLPLACHHVHSPPLPPPSLILTLHCFFFLHKRKWKPLA